MMLNFNFVKNSFSIFLLVVVVVNCHNGYNNDVEKRFQEVGVVPDVIEKPPHRGLKVTYNNKEVEYGNELTPTETKDIPSVEWKANANDFYTFIMTDPDAPSRADPAYAQWLHWTVVNIPGNKLWKGETLAEYVGAGPGAGNGFHRYVFLLYKQHRKQDFNEPILNNRSADGRAKTSVKDFVAKHRLGEVDSGNFYQAQYDDYVPILYQQLGL